MLFRSNSSKFIFGGAPDRCGDINGDRTSFDELRASNPAACIAPGHEGAENHRHRVNQRGLVQAVPFLIVNLVTIDECGGARRDATPRAPNACRRAGAPVGRDRLEVFDEWDAGSRQTHSDRVENEGLGRLDGLG